MSRKGKYSLSEKLRVIQEYISSEKGATQIINIFLLFQKE